MAAEIRADDVRRIAALARLDLTDAEVDRFAAQLTEILRYAGVIAGIDTTGIRATSHPHELTSVGREDDERPGLSPADVFDQAPDAAADAGLFRVPKVL